MMKYSIDRLLTILGSTHEDDCVLCQSRAMLLALHAALRTAVVYPAFEDSSGTCKRCKTYWTLSSGEQHARGCLAAPLEKEHEPTAK